MGGGGGVERGQKKEREKKQGMGLWGGFKGAHLLPDPFLPPKEMFFYRSDSAKRINLPFRGKNNNNNL